MSSEEFSKLACEIEHDGVVVDDPAVVELWHQTNGFIHQWIARFLVPGRYTFKVSVDVATTRERRATLMSISRDEIDSFNAAMRGRSSSVADRPGGMEDGKTDASTLASLASMDGAMFPSMLAAEDKVGVCVCVGGGWVVCRTLWF